MNPTPPTDSAAAAESRLLVVGLVLAAGGAIAFSGKAIIVKLAYRHGVDAITLLMLRMLFALPLFMLLAWWASRGQPALTRRDLLGVAGLGFSGYYLSSYLDFVGLQYISASLERLIMYLTPTLVPVLGWLLYRKAIVPSQAIGAAISYCGVLMVFGHEVRVDGAQTALGAMLVLASATTYAVYLVYSGELVKRLGALRLVGLATSVACVLCVLQFVALRPLGAALEVAPQVIWWSVLNATLCTAVPVLLVMMAIERIGPALTAQVGMIGPLSTLAMGVVVLGEAFTGWTLAGTLAVLTGIYVVTRGARA